LNIDGSIEQSLSDSALQIVKQQTGETKETGEQVGIFMSDSARLNKSVKYIRETFFPRWDKRNEWVIKKDENLPSFGSCSNRKSKTISLRYIDEDENNFYCLLIHEICHAVTNDNHGKKWKERVLKASDKAKSIGRLKLTELLKIEVKEYGPGKTIGSIKQIYEGFEDYVIDYPHILPYDQIIEKFAKSWGLYSDELEQMCKRIRKVYEQAIELRKNVRGE